MCPVSLILSDLPILYPAVSTSSFNAAPSRYSMRLPCRNPSRVMISSSSSLSFHQLAPQLQNTGSFSGIRLNRRSTAISGDRYSRNAITRLKYSSLEHKAIVPFSYSSHNLVFLAI